MTSTTTLAEGFRTTRFNVTTSTTTLAEGFKTTRFNFATLAQCRDISLRRSRTIANVATSVEMIITVEAMSRHQGRKCNKRDIS